jgi:hypothetical protein
MEYFESATWRVSDAYIRQTDRTAKPHRSLSQYPLPGLHWAEEVTYDDGEMSPSPPLENDDVYVREKTLLMFVEWSYEFAWEHLVVEPLMNSESYELDKSEDELLDGRHYWQSWRRAHSIRGRGRGRRTLITGGRQFNCN